MNIASQAIIMPIRRKKKRYFYYKKRYIIDIVDWKTTLKTQWYRRKKYYEEKEYPIKIIPISYKEINL